MLERSALAIEPAAAAPRRAKVSGAAVMRVAVPVVATVAQRGGGFISEVKRRPDAELRTVTHATRDALPREIADWLAARWPRRRS